MNYYNHSLRTNLQEWKNRLHKASEPEFSNQLSYFVSNIEKEKSIMGILNEVCSKYSFDKVAIHKRLDFNSGIVFANSQEQAAFSYQCLKSLVNDFGYEQIKYLDCWRGSGWEASRSIMVETLITPIVYFAHDELDRSSSIIFLLEKYKCRMEWFTKTKLVDQYDSLDKNYEQLLEDDLRLFLFDQGIEYPFSTPKSTSGRADIIGEIETNDPLVLEIKIIDGGKGYGKPRIRDGFTQIVKYTNDYLKDVGYLVIFNFDDIEIDFGSLDSTKVFPPRFQFGNKTYYFIVINMFIGESASKSGKTKRMEINGADLIA